MTDTIAAIATAPGTSGIGVVRISGPQSLPVADRIFRERGGIVPFLETPTHTIHYGHIVGMGNGEVIDEVLVMVMKGPRSYTAEDTVEIDCHGGSLVMGRILQEAVRAGARIAEPGEFTKRAFLNGRIDLAQAEAVMDVIEAKNEYALKSSVRQLKGSLSERIRDLRKRILYPIAYIESALDDPEHNPLDGYGEQLMEGLISMMGEIESLIRSNENGRVLKEGIRTVILGKPNAGKSSLMNLLVGEERAIVTDVAGTTRDILEEHIRLKGISFNLIDTAGIRDTEDTVEKIGVRRAREMAKEADLIIYLVDGSCPLDGNDEEIVEAIRDRKSVVLLNKSDLPLVVSRQALEEKTGHKVLMISAKEESGIDELVDEIESMFYQGIIEMNDQIYVTNQRHRTALEQALESLGMVKKSIEDGMPEDFYSIDLMQAYEQLGTIVGESVEDDLVEEIFSRFCTGK